MWDVIWDFWLEYMESKKEMEKKLLWLWKGQNNHTSRIRFNCWVFGCSWEMTVYRYSVIHYINGWDRTSIDCRAVHCTAVSYNLFRVSPLTALGLKLLTSCIPARFGASTISGGLHFYFLFYFIVFSLETMNAALLQVMVWYGIGLWKGWNIGWVKGQRVSTCNFCFQVLVIILWQGTGHKHCTWHMVLGFLPSVMMFCRKTKANLNFKEQFLKIVLNYF